MASIPYLLRPLLGDDPATVTPDQLAKLIGQAETQQADWKRQLNDDRKTNLDLAVDVAAFANATGGLIVVGLDEDTVDKGRAAAFVGVADTGTLVDRIDSAVRDRVQPPVTYEAVAVAGPDGNEVVLIAVEPSEASPHCAVDGKNRIYPVRSGAGKGYLSEPEIAEWYGRRLRRIVGQDARTDELRRDAVPADLLGPDDTAWLVLTLVPARPGAGRLRPGDLEAYRAVLKTDKLRALPGAYSYPWNLRVGHRSLIASDFFDTPQQRAVLAVDGSGSAAFRWSAGEPKGGGVRHNLGMVAQELTWLLDTLVAHAVQRGAAGTATVSAEVIARPTLTLRVGDEIPSNRPFTFEDIPTRPAPTPVSRVTVDIDAIASSTTALLAATHLIGVDVASSFGHADLPALTSDGHLRPRGLSVEADHPHLVSWAARYDVSIAT
jgi:hypothetical protein